MALSDDKKTEFFSFSRTTFDCIQELSDDSDKAKAYDAICRYGLDGDEPSDLHGTLKVIFMSTKPYIRRCRSQARFGNKNAAKTPKNASKTRQNADTVYTNTNTNTNTETETIPDVSEVRRRRLEGR